MDLTPKHFTAKNPNLPKPVALSNKNKARSVNGISYGLNLWGYQYSDFNGTDYVKQVTAWVSNDTDSEQYIRFSINSFNNDISCVKVLSIDGITGGGTSTISNDYKILWRLGKTQPGKYCTTTFTLRIKDPFSCVEGSYVMEMDTPFTTTSNYTDDYIYLIQ